jgi:lipopolysaccharide/colanic/teichoic acid biosynthesis glycosyltransferase
MNLVIVNSPRVSPHRPNNQNAKRFVDIFICIAALPFIIPLFLVCMLVIYIDSGLPFFFVQERIGRGGRPFRIYKFRTMVANHDDGQGRSFMRAYIRGEVGDDKTGTETFKPASSTVITRVGRFLRRTSLDELPQLINILKGEMSIVGPRPNVTWEVDAYLPWHYERLEVLPGMTGLAQVNGRSGIRFDSLVRYDIRYIENQNLALDVNIIWKTFSSVIFSKGAA